ncbi:hypothetical protein NC651_004612 [Populus alba x Populus x berolinensis]|nr:hypothetical protein NC651_004612 [Populus alba x Populus x berolinensis]
MHFFSLQALCSQVLHTTMVKQLEIANLLDNLRESKCPKKIVLLSIYSGTSEAEFLGDYMHRCETIIWHQWWRVASERSMTIHMTALFLHQHPLKQASREP